MQRLLTFRELQDPKLTKETLEAQRAQLEASRETASRLRELDAVMSYKERIELVDARLARGEHRT